MEHHGAEYTVEKDKNSDNKYKNLKIQENSVLVSLNTRFLYPISTVKQERLDVFMD